MEPKIFTSWHGTAVILGMINSFVVVADSSSTPTTNKYLQTILPFFFNSRQDDWRKFPGDRHRQYYLSTMNSYTAENMKFSLIANEVLLYGLKLRNSLDILAPQDTESSLLHRDLDSAAARRCIKTRHRPYPEEGQQKGQSSPI